MQNRFAVRTHLSAVSVALITALTVNGHADVKLPRVFGSHMVLQQDKPAIVWGWARAGEKVTVQIQQAKKETKANPQGEWRVTLPPMKAGGPFEMTVTGSNQLKLDDVLVGEVWLCSGQSNMEMDVAASDNAEEEIRNANHPQMRLFLVPKKVGASPEKDVDAQWQVCSPETISKGPWKGFPAAGYYFGREIQKELKVPVGLIGSSWGGTRIEPWTPPEGFAMVPELREIHDRLGMSDPRRAPYKERMRKVLGDTERWVAEARRSLKEEKAVPAMPTVPDELLPPKGNTSPTGLYNGMIHPLAPFAIRGALWYQGESNHSEKDYAAKMKALVGGWRKVWGQDDFPFYYVQIAPFTYGGDPRPTIVPEFWEQQSAALSIPNTGMAVINDIADLKDIHPKNKQEVGRRLALLALAGTYGRKDVVCSGPTFKSMKTEGNKLRIRFDSAGSGLASRDGKPLTWFEIVDEKQGGWVSADAAIDGDTVVLSSPKVEKPVAMRYAWSMLAEPNLMNKEGLPASAFRAGDKPVRDLLGANVPEAKDYKLVYDLDLNTAGEKIVYKTDNSRKVKCGFDRVAYFLELEPNEGEPQYVYVSMDAFTKDPGRIGVPTADSKASFQQDVANMNVVSNVKGVVTGEGLTGGNIEFWPNNYGAENLKKVPDASGTAWDFGDQPGDPVNGYGCMQVHNHAARQTIFAFNHWRQGEGADLGIGNSPKGNPDWTFEATAKNYQAKRLRVFVRCGK